MLLYAKKASLSFLIFILLIGQTFSYVSANELQDQAEVRSRVLQLQQTDPTLPGGTSEQKGVVGTLLSRLFNTDGKIKQIFLQDVFSGLSGGKIAYYSDGNDAFLDSVISASPAAIGIGAGLLSGYIANFTGDVNIVGDLDVSGSITASDPTLANEVATKSYVDSQSVSIGNATTTSTGVVQLSGDIGGTYNNLQLTANSVGTNEVANDSLTANDLAPNSVGDSELIDNPSFATLNATSTSGISWENGVNRITHNDGGGNVQIRFGNDYSSGDERFTHGGTAFYIGGSQDSAGQPLNLKVATNGGSGNDQPVVWGPSLSIGPSTLTWNGLSVLTAGFSGDQILDETIDSSEIQNNTLTASDLAANSVGNSELGLNAVNSSNVVDNSLTASDIAANAIGSSELANNTVTSAKISDGTITNADISSGAAIGGTKISPDFGAQSITTRNPNNSGASASLNFNGDTARIRVGGTGLGASNGLDIQGPGDTSLLRIENNGNLTTSGTIVAASPTSSNQVTTKSYVDNLVQGLVWKEPNSNSQTCNSSREGWATYNTTTNIVYVCNGTSWVDIGSTAVVPNATTTSAGKVQLSGDIGGTWNNVQLNTNSVGSNEVADNSLTAADLASDSVGNSELSGNAVNSANVVDNSLTTADLGVASVSSSELSRTLTYSDNVGNANYNSITIDHNASGGDILSADRTRRGLFLDFDSSASGGDTANEHRIYAVHSDLDISGDSDLVYGGYFDVNSTHSSGQITNQRGTFNYARSNGLGTVSSLQGAYNLGVDSSNGTVGLTHGSLSRALKDSGSTNTSSSMIGAEGEVEVDAGVLTNGYAVKALIDRDGGSITNGYLFHGDYTGTQPSNAYGVYIVDSVRNYFAGNVGLGNNNPTEKLVVNGRISVITDPNSDDDVGDRAYNDGRYVNVGEAINGDSITDGTIDSSEIQDNTLTANDLAPNSVGNSELADDIELSSVRFNKAGVIDYKNLAHYNNSSASVTGVMKITMGKSWSNTMGTTIIKGYNYGSNIGAWEVVVGGYNYAGAGGAWYNRSAEIRGTAPFDTVRLGHDGTRNIILLGTTSTVWNYPKAVVSEFMAGHTQQTGWESGWSIGIQNNETGFSSLVAPQIYSYMTNAGNLGIGTISPQERLAVSGRISITTDPNSDDDVGDRLYNDGRYINTGEAINGDQVQDGTIDSSEIQDNTLTASDLAANSVGSSELANNAVTGAKITDGTILAADIGANAVGNSELIDNPTVTSLTITGTPTSSNDAATKSYVDNLVQGLVWKEPNSNSQTCNSSREGWATYNTTTNIVYVCNGTSWVDIGSTAVVPNATTTSAGKVQLSGDIGGTWNNVQLNTNSVGSNEVADNSLTAADLANGSVAAAEIQDGQVRTQEIANNTITETDISDSFIARAASKVNASSYGWIGDLNASPRSMHDEGISVGLVNAASHNAPISYGSLVNFPSYTAGQDGGAGQLLFPYDLSYTGNGNPMFRTGDYNNAGWSSWKTMMDKDWADSLYIGVGDSIPGDQIQDGTIDSSEIQDNTLTANDLATNSVGNAELIDVPTVTQLNIAAGNNNGVRFWSSDLYEMSMGNTASTHRYGPVTDYSIKTNMSNTAGRGFTWGVSGLSPTVAFEAQSGNAQFAGTVTAATPTAANHLATKAYVDSNSGLWSLNGSGEAYYTPNVGIGNTNPGEKLSVTGRISVTADPNSNDDVGDRGYNDGRYINVGESGDTIQDGTIDSSEIQDNTLTANDLAANSVGNSELIDAPTFTNVITGNTGINIIGGSPIMRYTDSGAEDDFWTHVNSNNFYVLADRNNDSAWDGPHPLQLEADTNIAYTFGQRIFTYGTSGDNIADNTIDGSEIQNNSITAADIGSNAVGNDELINNPTVTTLTVTSSPTAGNHAATKAYVDANSGGSSVWSVNGSGEAYYTPNVGIGNTNPSQKLHVSGNILATAYLYSSDEKLKFGISEIDNSLEIVKQLRGVDFTWKDSGKKDIGFIAQEMEQVLPELVATDVNTGLKSVQYGNVTAVLVEAIKEQQKQIEELQAELQEVKENISK